MTVEYLLVSFPEDRDVLLDGDRVGVTNHTIMVTANEYEITLSGTGYEPTSRDEVVAGTSIMRPKVVVFTRAAAVAVMAGAAAAAVTGGLGGGLPVDPGLSQPAPRSRRRKPPTA